MHPSADFFAVSAQVLPVLMLGLLLTDSLAVQRAKDVLGEIPSQRVASVAVVYSLVLGLAAAWRRCCAEAGWSSRPGSSWRHGS